MAAEGQPREDAWRHHKGAQGASLPKISHARVEALLAARQLGTQIECCWVRLLCRLSL